MKSVLIDNNGLIKEIKQGDYKTLPDGHIQISEADFARIMAQSDLIWKLNVTTGEVFSESPPAPTLADLKQAKKAEIIGNFEQAMQQIISGYPSDEISSWDKQEAEARAFSGNPAAVTPLIDALCGARGVTKADLVSRIIAKANLFATVSGQLIGKRQGLEDQIDAVTSKTALAAIAW